MRSVYPHRAWSEARQLSVSQRQQVLDLAEAMAGVPKEERTRIKTPWDDVLKAYEEKRAREEAEKAKAAADYIRNQKWESV